VDNAARAEIDAAIGRYLERLSTEIEADAKAGCPVDTGELVASIEHEVSGQTARIGSNVKYAAIVELGAGPHIIRAKNARVLANRDTGEVFGPIVHHPGTPAQAYLAPALLRERDI
jgi:hypothetical protein